MPSKESKMRSDIIKLMRPLHAVAIENGCEAGTPDINYRDGWIECKSVDMPANPDTPVRVEHFTTDQRLWLRMRRQADGVALMLLKIGQWWLLLDGEVAAEIVGNVPFNQLFDNSIDAWYRMPNRKILLECLRKV